jgi:hypothetical protein
MVAVVAPGMVGLVRDVSVAGEVVAGVPVVMGSFAGVGMSTTSSACAESAF